MSYPAVDTKTTADEEEVQLLEQALAASPDVDAEDWDEEEDPLGARCRQIVRQLRHASFEDRIAVYEGSTYRELAAASGRYPELMPIVNDEFEWIELLLVDHG